MNEKSKITRIGTKFSYSPTMVERFVSELWTCFLRNIHEEARIIIEQSTIKKVKGFTIVFCYEEVNNKKKILPLTLGLQSPNLLAEYVSILQSESDMDLNRSR